MTKPKRLLPFLIVIAGPAFAGALKVEVKDGGGRVVENAVVATPPPGLPETSALSSATTSMGAPATNPTGKL